MKISSHAAKILIEYIQANNIFIGEGDLFKIERLVKELDLKIPDNDKVISTIMPILKDKRNSHILQEYKNGNLRVVLPIVNQVMQIHRGAEPKWVRKLVVAGVEFLNDSGN